MLYSTFETDLPRGAYLNNTLQAPPVSCRGGARFSATIPDWIRIPLPRPFSPQSLSRLGGEGPGEGLVGVTIL